MALRNDVIALYTALGGGWENSTVKVPKPQIAGNPPLMPAAADALATTRH
jgi:hypothetical protein